MATWLTYEMETLPVHAPEPEKGTFTAPGKITVKCDGFGDLALFIMYGRQAIDRRGVQDEEILADLQRWCLTGVLPAESPTSLDIKRRRQAQILLTHVMELIEGRERP